MRKTLVLIAACAVWAGVSTVNAANVQIQVLDRNGAPVPDAVVVLYPAGAPAAAGSAPPLLPSSSTIEQEKMRFVPAVTVVAPGSTVRFTNQDSWDHHVRGNAAGAAAAAAGDASGSGFSLRLAGKKDGGAASFADVPLNTPGVVLLGCHLHNSMRGHVFVSDSPWALKTDGDGMAHFANVPEGSAQMRVWYAEQLIDLPLKPLQVLSGPVKDTLQLNVVPLPPRRAPPANYGGSGGSGSYGNYSNSP